MTVHRLVAGAWAAACGALYSAIAILRFDGVVPASYDHAIFEEAIRGYSRLHAPIVPIKGPGFNLLGDHFSPIIALVAPFYRVFPDARTLMVAQAVLLAMSVFIVTFLAWDVAGPWVGSALGVTYGLSFGLLAAVRAGFHEVAFAAPLLALAGAAFVHGRHRSVVGWSLPLLFVKEDLGLTVAAIGLALIFRGDRRRGSWLMIGGLAGVLVTIIVLIPLARSGSGYAYGLGTGGILDDPRQKLITLVFTLGVGGLVGLASPWILAIAPTLAWRFAADNPYYWGTDFHYSLVLMPIAAIATVDVIQRHRHLQWPAVMLAIAFSIVTLSASPMIDRGDPDRREAAAKVLAVVPEGTRVETDIGLMSQLVTGRDVTWVGTLGNPVPDWVVLDHDPSLHSPSDAASYATARYHRQYGTVVRIADFDVARDASSVEHREPRRAGHR